MSRLKVASFTLKADAEQSVRWKRASEAEGFPSVGAWAALALDAYLKHRARAGMPVALAWSRGRIVVTLDGKAYTVSGHSSPPFASWRGTVEKPTTYKGTRKHLLLYLPEGRVLATLHSFRECQALASELARTWVRWTGEPPGKPADEVLRAFR
jgi:hypothetical protein